MIDRIRDLAKDKFAQIVFAILAGHIMHFGERELGKWSQAHRVAACIGSHPNKSECKEELKKEKMPWYERVLMFELDHADKLIGEE